MFRHLREDIASVFHRDPAARNFVEVLTCYPGLHALLIHRIAHWLWRYKLKWLARFLSTLGRFLTGIEIHPGAQIGKRFFIDHGMGIVIGETAIIGDDVTLYHGVTLGGTSWQMGKRHPTLNDGVIVGAGAKILGPFTVGEKAKIGSNAVVIKAVPAGATVVGVPGTIIQQKTMPTDADNQADSANQQQFAAYGIHDNASDPVSQSIKALVDHIEAMDKKMLCMANQIKQLDASYQTDDVPQLNQEQLASVKALCDQNSP